MFIGLIILTLSAYLLDLSAINKTLNYHTKKYTIHENLRENSNEYLLSQLKFYLEKNIHPLTYEEIKKAFKREEIYEKKYGKSYIEYLKKNKKENKEQNLSENKVYFKVITIYKSKFRDNDIYECIIDQGKVKFKHLGAEN